MLCHSQIGATSSSETLKANNIRVPSASMILEQIASVVTFQSAAEEMFCLSGAANLRSRLLRPISAGLA